MSTSDEQHKSLQQRTKDFIESVRNEVTPAQQAEKERLQAIVADKSKSVKERNEAFIQSVRYK